MNDLIETLKGKKTYFLAGIGAIVTFLYFLGVIDQAMYIGILGLLGFGSAASIRAGMKER
jgi:hypothetical protein